MGSSSLVVLVVTSIFLLAVLAFVSLAVEEAAAAGLRLLGGELPGDVPRRAAGGGLRLAGPGLRLELPAAGGHAGAARSQGAGVVGGLGW